MELEVGGPAAEAVEVAGPVVAERQGRALRQRKPVNYNVKSMESNGSNTPSWLKSTVRFFLVTALLRRSRWNTNVRTLNPPLFTRSPTARAERASGGREGEQEAREEEGKAA